MFFPDIFYPLVNEAVVRKPFGLDSLTHCASLR